MRAGQGAEIGSLLADIVTPPFESIGALSVDQLLSKRARRELAVALNTLLASPSFASWRQGLSPTSASGCGPSTGARLVMIVAVWGTPKGGSPDF